MLMDKKLVVTMGSKDTHQFEHLQTTDDALPTLGMIADDYLPILFSIC